RACVPLPRVLSEFWGHHLRRITADYARPPCGARARASCCNRAAQVGADGADPMSHLLRSKRSLERAINCPVDLCHDADGAYIWARDEQPHADDTIQELGRGADHWEALERAEAWLRGRRAAERAEC